MEPTELRFRAMGSPCRIVTDPNSGRAAEEIRSLVEYLERCWSRFLHDSEVSAVNRAAGRVTVVSDMTYKLIANAVRAHDRTGGRFNPLILEPLDTASFSFNGGAVTTSTTARRRWNSNGTVLHHLLDPTTGRPSTSDVVSVTTCSALAWWGEPRRSPCWPVPQGPAGHWPTSASPASW